MVEQVKAAVLRTWAKALFWTGALSVATLRREGSVLERQGHRVIQARDGQQGKQQIYQQRPDLVILDMMMPRMGGYPVLEHFRGKTDVPPIIMITANEGSRHKAYAEYLGVIDYIRKPFAMERLLDTVNKALRPQPKPAPKEGEAKEE